MTNDAWGLSFGYDGFGNLTQQTRVQGTTAPTMSVTVDPGTNRITAAGYVYDANGNVTQTPDGMTYGYDVANRMVSNGAVYNPKNQRVFDGTYLYYYGVGGELIGKYQPSWGFTITVNGIRYTRVTLQDRTNLYFNGRAIQLQGHGAFVMTDRLGSVRVNGSGQRMNYYPYGAEVGAETGEGRVKFGTYTRDSAGVDYADQRYYGAGMGRFLTPDPGKGGTAGSPSSWNRYLYVHGDPVNFRDPSGLNEAPPDDGCGEEEDDMPCFSVTGYGDDGGGGGGGGGGYDPCEVDPAGCGVPDPSPLPNPDPNPYRPECDRSIGNNAMKLDWIAAHGADAAKAGIQIGTTEAIILGLSALESGWGTGPFVANGRNNFFSQHAPAPGSNGSVTQNGNRMATYAGYLASALGFDASSSGQLIKNMTDPSQVASTLQNAKKYGINRDGTKVKNFVKDVSSTINGLALRLDCPK
jgi:RHS repeat-associated protein